MSERLTAEEIERLRETLPEWHQALPLHVIRIAEHMLHLHDIIQRLQNLQSSDVTPEELEACNNEAVGWMVYSHTIAAVCRGMLREV